MTTLAEIICELDSLPATFEGLVEFYGSDKENNSWLLKVTELYPLAKHNLECYAVALEEGEPFDPSKELRLFRMINVIKPTAGDLTYKKLKHAIKNNDFKLVELLLCNTDLKFNGYEIIRTFWKHYNTNGIEMFYLLLKDSRFNTLYAKQYSFKASAAFECIEVMDLLLQDKEVDPSMDHNVAIHHACLIGNTKQLKGY